MHVTYMSYCWILLIIIMTSDNCNMAHLDCICVPFWECRNDLISGLRESEDRNKSIRQLISSSANHQRIKCDRSFDVCCKLECGQPGNAEMGGKILGISNEADFAEFPWMIGIKENGMYKCGASLIHPRVVLTAAHCVDEIGRYIARAGEWNWETTDEVLQHEDRNIEKVIIHERYEKNSLRHDIALLIVERPFTLAKNIGIACIPFQEDLYDGFSCVVSGWGKIFRGASNFQSTLRKSVITIVPREQCIRALQIYLGPALQLDSSFICGGGISENTCKGDGGSPLVCPSFNRFDRFIQTGIVSWGLTCGLLNAPGLFVEVAQYSDWIDKQMLLNHFNINGYRLK